MKPLFLDGIAHENYKKMDLPFSLESKAYFFNEKRHLLPKTWSALPLKGQDLLVFLGIAFLNRRFVMFSVEKVGNAFQSAMKASLWYKMEIQNPTP